MSGDPEPTVRYEVSDGVALLTLNRPDALNAVTMEMEALLEERLREADDERTCRITGDAAQRPGHGVLHLPAHWRTASAAFDVRMGVDDLPGLARLVGPAVATAPPPGHRSTAPSRRSSASRSWMRPEGVRRPARPGSSRRITTPTPGPACPFGTGTTTGVAA